MTEHLPECEAYRDECGGGCICHHVRACERRVLDDAVQRVTELPDLIDAGFAYYMNLLNRAAVIDAIRGEP